jgi:serine phosphatase RsbU (regulator of sigma subunit)
MFMRLLKKYTLVFLLLTVVNQYAQTTKADSIRSQLKTVSNDTTRVNLLVALSVENIKTQPTNTTILDCLDEAMALAAKNKFTKGVSNVWSTKGMYFFYNYDYTTAISMHENALTERIKLKADKKIAQTFFNIGTCYLRLTKYEKAIEYNVRALKIYEEVKDDFSVYGLLNNIGGIYYNQNNYNKALEYFLKALEVIKHNGNKAETASELNNIGQLYTMMQDNKAALNYFNQALEINKQTNDLNTYAEIMGNIGSLYLKINRYDKAEEFLQNAKRINEKVDNKLNLANNLTNISEIYDKQNDFSNTIKYLEDALAIEKQIDDKEQLKLTYHQLEGAYKKYKKIDKAYYYLKQYSVLQDTLFNKESAQQIADMETKYKTEKKEKENQLLNKQLEIKNIQSREQKIYLLISIIIVALVGFLAVNLLRQNKQKQKTNLQLAEKNKIIEEKSHLVEEQHKDITDSIKYAQRIQQAILPPEKMWFDIMPDSFVFYAPKDILSGDFYWIEQKNDTVYVAAADCTGHGVPGALMSMVNYNLLNKAVLELNLDVPSQILDAVNKWLTISLHQTYNESAVRDGMDIALCSINKKTKQMQFAGAFNGGYIFKKDGSFIDMNGDKKPVGLFIEDKIQLFTNHDFKLEAGDRIFIFSDGYTDQFGGPKGKKLKYQNFKKYIAESTYLTMPEQKKFLQTKFMEWKGNYEQVDDVLVIGICV